MLGFNIAFSYSPLLVLAFTSHFIFFSSPFIHHYLNHSLKYSSLSFFFLSPTFYPLHFLRHCSLLSCLVLLILMSWLWGWGIKEKKTRLSGVKAWVVAAWPNGPKGRVDMWAAAAAVAAASISHSEKFLYERVFVPQSASVSFSFHDTQPHQQPMDPQKHLHLEGWLEH